MEAKDAKITELSALLDESAMNEHLKQLSEKVSDLKDKVGVLEEEKVNREQEIGGLRNDLETSEAEKSSIFRQLEDTQETLKVTELNLKGWWHLPLLTLSYRSRLVTAHSGLISQLERALCLLQITPSTAITSVPVSSC